MPLSASEDPLFTALLDTAPIGIALLDHDCRYVRINRILAASNGLPIDDHIGRQPRDVLPSVGADLETIMRSVMANGQSMHFEAEAEIPPGSGNKRFWIAGYHPYRPQPDQAPAGIIAMVEDVTARREVERLQQESEAQVRRVLDNLFAFVGLLSPDGTLLEANRAPLEAAGIRLDEVRGKKFWDCYWWNYDEAIRDRIRQAAEAAAQGEVSRFDIIVRMAGDSRMTIDFMMAPLRDESGRITHLIPSAIDISDRTRSEQALRDSEARLRQVVEATPDGLVMVDGHGTIQLVNSSLEAMTGYSRNALVGQSINLLIPHESQASHAEWVSAFFRQPSRRDMANRKPLHAIRADGSTFPCEIGLNPLQGAEHTLVLAAITDVTERLLARQAIEKALQEKTVLLGEVHHRVKNNLQVISSLLSLQARNAPPLVRAALTDSQNHVRAMALIHQLLYERNDFTQISLSAYLQQLCILLKHSVGSNHPVSLHLHLPPQEILLGIQQIIPLGLMVNELITNAYKHAFPSGRAGEISLTLSRADRMATLSVCDDGAGMPTGKALGGSDSLGFQLLPMLADQLQGELLLHPAPGQGTRFDIRFPILPIGEPA